MSNTTKNKEKGMKKFTIGELISHKSDWTIECQFLGGFCIKLTPDINKKISNKELDKVKAFDGYEISVDELLNIEITGIGSKKLNVMSSLRYAFYNSSISNELKDELKRATMIAAVNVLSQEKYRDELKYISVIG